MFCKNCGTQIADTATKCEKCGFELEKQVQNKKNDKLEMKMDINVNQIFQKYKKIAIVGAAVIVLVVVVILMVANKKTVVNLNDYVTVTFSGYDSIGTAEYEFDRDAFLFDYENVIMKKVKKDNTTKYFDNPGASSFLSSCVEGKIDKDSDLSNGDIVKLKWNCQDEKAEEQYNVKLKYEETEYKVEGLTEPAVIDPFEAIEVVFSGIAPFGELDVRKTSAEDIYRFMFYEPSKSDGLSNGDEIVVKISGNHDNEYFIRQYGIVLAETEKTYVVEGLSNYVQSSSEISEDMMNKMKKQAEDKLLAATTEFDKEVKATNIKYIGNYFLKQKFSSHYSLKNMMYLMYKVDTLFTNDKHSESGTFYYYVRYEDVINLPDGSSSVDLSRTETAFRNNYSHKYIWGEKWGDSKTVSFPGYENLDTAFNNLVTSNIENYDYENNITE